MQLVIVLIVCAVLILGLIGREGLQTVNPEMGSPCKIDEDCHNGFCYMGQCWGYWKGYPMPWSTCRNPYCGSTSAYASCSASQGKCMPYCKCKLNRRLGGSINLDCFPKCGKPCLSNDECPAGCPACSHGICSAPNVEKPVF